MLKFIKKLFLKKLSEEKKEMMIRLIELLDNCNVPREVQDPFLAKALKLSEDELDNVIYELSNFDCAKTKLEASVKALDDLCLKKSKEIDEKIEAEVELIRKEVENELKNLE